jgi:hypothetical protein
VESWLESPGMATAGPQAHMSTILDRRLMMRCSPPMIARALAGLDL